MRLERQAGEFSLVSGRRIRWRYDRLRGGPGSAFLVGGQSGEPGQAWVQALERAGFSCFSFEPAPTSQSELVEVYRAATGAAHGGEAGRWVLIGLDPLSSASVACGYYELYATWPPVACVLFSPSGAKESDLGKISCPFLIIDSGSASGLAEGNALHERSVLHHGKRYGDATRLIQLHGRFSEGNVIVEALDWLMPISKHLGRPNVSRALASVA